MKNPFQYGGVVEDDAFCNRKKELADLLRAMENGDKMFVYSERRFGKTSLVKLALAKLPKKRYVTVYIDLWPTDSETAFVTTVAKAITEAMGTRMDGMMNAARTLFTHLLPSMTMDKEGKPVVTFGLAKSQKIQAELDEVLAAPLKIAKQGKRDVVIVFDEFQRIVEYGDDDVERKLRSIVQTHKRVSYIFLGSRKHVIQKMFLEKSRPLYRSAAHYPIGPIAEQHWQPFIRERFAKARKHISNGHMHALCELTEGHPFYTQHLCHALWELCENGRSVTDAMLDEAVDMLLTREQFAYTVLWESLTRNQQRFLKAFASLDASAKPFASEFLQRHRLGSPSAAQRVVATLLESDIIDRDNGSFVILDRFFQLWIRRL